MRHSMLIVNALLAVGASVMPHVPPENELVKGRVAPEEASSQARSSPSSNIVRQPYRAKGFDHIISYTVDLSVMNSATLKEIARTCPVSREEAARVDTTLHERWQEKQQERQTAAFASGGKSGFEYLLHPAMQARQRLAASLLSEAECTHTLEIGGFVTPVDTFLAHSPNTLRAYSNFDAELAVGRYGLKPRLQNLLLPSGLCIRDAHYPVTLEEGLLGLQKTQSGSSIYDFEHEESLRPDCIVILGFSHGMHSGGGVAQKELLRSAKLVIVETTPQCTTCIGEFEAQLDDLRLSHTTKLDVTLNLTQNGIPPSLWGPRTMRRVVAFEKGGQQEDSGSPRSHGVPFREILDVDGIRSRGTNEVLQTFLNGQCGEPKFREDKVYVDGDFGESTKKALQTFLFKTHSVGAKWREEKTRVDGHFGQASVQALQTFLNAHCEESKVCLQKLGVDGNFGTRTVKALQTFLNTHCAGNPGLMAQPDPNVGFDTLGCSSDDHDLLSSAVFRDSRRGHVLSHCLSNYPAAMHKVVAQTLGLCPGKRAWLRPENPEMWWYHRCDQVMGSGLNIEVMSRNGEVPPAKHRLTSNDTLRGCRMHESHSIHEFLKDVRNLSKGTVLIHILLGEEYGTQQHCSSEHLEQRWDRLRDVVLHARGRGAARIVIADFNKESGLFDSNGCVPPLQDLRAGATAALSAEHWQIVAEEYACGGTASGSKRYKTSPGFSPQRNVFFVAEQIADRVSSRVS